MHGIPPVLDTDSEDVAWALQTADALWLRNERVDAIVWLRRAAQAAGDADDNDRALLLARAAAELSELVNQPVSVAVEMPPPPSAPGVHDSIEELLQASAPGAPGADLPPMRPPAPSAAEAHAGMHNPWHDDETKELERPAIARPESFDRPLLDDQEELTETVTAIGDQHGKAVLPLGPNEIFDDDVITSAKGIDKPFARNAAQARVVPPDAPTRPAPALEPPPEATSSTPGTGPATPGTGPVPHAPVAAPAPPVSSQRPASSAKGAPLPKAKGPPAAKAPSAPKSRRGAPPAPRKPPPVPPPRKPPPPAPLPPPIVAPSDEPPTRASSTEFLSEADLVSVPPSPLADSQTIHLPPGGGEGDSVTTRIAGEVADAFLPSVDREALEESVETEVQHRNDIPGLAEAIAAAGTAPPPDATEADMAPAVHESGTMATTSSVRLASLPVPADEDLSDLAADPDIIAAIPREPERVTDRPVDVHRVGGKEVVELDGIDALTDIPDDEREAFAARATLHDLGADDEIVNFALALVISGDVDVVATVLDAAERLPAGTVLRSRGTNEKGFELRLVCRSQAARVATWPRAPVEAAFKSCPWVEDDLRIATDRIQALVGITSGPLADRMDASLRQEVVQRMTTRALAPNEVLLEKGQTVPALFLVGVNGLDLVDGLRKTGDVIVGDFVFPNQVLGAGAAPQTVRAPPEGAVVLFADRKIAQELLVTCPPLLEILAGM
jgi:hypothetical protein